MFPIFSSLSKIGSSKLSAVKDLEALRNLSQKRKRRNSNSHNNKKKLIMKMNLSFFKGSSFLSSSRTLSSSLVVYSFKSKLSVGALLLQCRKLCYETNRKKPNNTKKNCCSSIDGKRNERRISIGIELHEKSKQDVQNFEISPKTLPASLLGKKSIVGQGYQLQHVLQRVFPPQPILFWNNEKKYSEWNRNGESMEEWNHRNALTSLPSPATLLRQLQHFHEPFSTSLPCGVIYTQTLPEKEYWRRVTARRRKRKVNENFNDHSSCFTSIGFFPSFSPAASSDGANLRRTVCMPLPALAREECEPYEREPAKENKQEWSTKCKQHRENQNTNLLPWTSTRFPFSSSPFCGGPTLRGLASEFLLQFYGQLQPVPKPLSAEMCSAHVCGFKYRSSPHKMNTTMCVFCEECGRRRDDGITAAGPSDYEEGEMKKAFHDICTCEEERESDSRESPLSAPPFFFGVTSTTTSIPYNQVLGIYFSPWTRSLSAASTATSTNTLSSPSSSCHLSASPSFCMKTARAHEQEEAVVSSPLACGNPGEPSTSIHSQYGDEDNKVSHEDNFDLESDEDEDGGGRKEEEEIRHHNDDSVSQFSTPQVLKHRTFVLYDDQDAHVREGDVAETMYNRANNSENNNRIGNVLPTYTHTSSSLFSDENLCHHVSLTRQTGGNRRKEGKYEERETKPGGCEARKKEISGPTEYEIQQCLSDVVVERCLCFPSSSSIFFSSPYHSKAYLPATATSAPSSSLSFTEEQDTDWIRLNTSTSNHGAFCATYSPLLHELRQTEGALQELMMAQRSHFISVENEGGENDHHTGKLDGVSSFSPSCSLLHQKSPFPPPHRTWNGEVWVLEEDGPLCRVLELIYKWTTEHLASFPCSSFQGLKRCNISSCENVLAKDREERKRETNAIEVTDEVKAMTSDTPRVLRSLLHPCGEEEKWSEGASSSPLPRAWVAPFWRSETRRNQLCFIPLDVYPTLPCGRRRRKAITPDITATSTSTGMPTSKNTSTFATVSAVCTSFHSLPYFSPSKNESGPSHMKDCHPDVDEDYRVAERMRGRDGHDENFAFFSFPSVWYNGAWQSIMTRRWSMISVQDYLLSHPSVAPPQLPRQPQRQDLSPSTSDSGGVSLSVNPLEKKNFSYNASTIALQSRFLPSSSSSSPRKIRQYCAQMGKLYPPYDAFSGLPLGPFLTSLLRERVSSSSVLVSLPTATGGIGSASTGGIGGPCMGQNSSLPTISNSYSATPFLFSTRYGSHPCWVPVPPTLSLPPQSRGSNNASSASSSCAAGVHSSVGHGHEFSRNGAEERREMKRKQPAAHSARFSYLTTKWMPEKDGDKGIERCPQKDERMTMKVGTREDTKNTNYSTGMNGRSSKSALDVSFSPTRNVGGLSVTLPNSSSSASSSFSFSEKGTNSCFSCTESVVVPLPYTITITGFLLWDPPQWFVNTAHDDDSALTRNFSSSSSTFAQPNHLSHWSTRPPFITRKVNDDHLPWNCLQKRCCVQEEQEKEEEDMSTVTRVVQNILDCYPLLPPNTAEECEGDDSSFPSFALHDTTPSTPNKENTFPHSTKVSPTSPQEAKDVLFLDILMENEDNVEEEKLGMNKSETREDMPSTNTIYDRSRTSVAPTASSALSYIHPTSCSYPSRLRPVPCLGWRRFVVPSGKKLVINYLFSVGSTKELQDVLPWSRNTPDGRRKMSGTAWNERARSEDVGKPTNMMKKSTNKPNKEKEEQGGEKRINHRMNGVDRICVVDLRAALQWIGYMESRMQHRGDACTTIRKIHHDPNPKEEEKNRTNQKDVETFSTLGEMRITSSSPRRGLPQRCGDSGDCSCSSFCFGPFHMLLPPPPPSSNFSDSLALRSPVEVAWALCNQWREAKHHPLISWDLSEYETFLDVILRKRASCCPPRSSTIVTNTTPSTSRDTLTSPTGTFPSSFLSNPETGAPHRTTEASLQKNEAVDVKSTGSVVFKPSSRRDHDASTDTGSQTMIQDTDLEQRYYDEDEEDNENDGRTFKKKMKRQGGCFQQQWEKRNEESRRRATAARGTGSYSHIALPQNSLVMRETSSTRLKCCYDIEEQGNRTDYFTTKGNKVCGGKPVSSNQLTHLSTFKISDRNISIDTRDFLSASPSMELAAGRCDGARRASNFTLATSAASSFPLLSLFHSASLERWECQWEKWLRYLQVFEEGDEAIREVVQRLTLRTRSRITSTCSAASTASTQEGNDSREKNDPIGKGGRLWNAMQKTNKQRKKYADSGEVEPQEQLGYLEEEDTAERDAYEEHREDGFVLPNLEEMPYSAVETPVHHYSNMDNVRSNSAYRSDIFSDVFLAPCSFSGKSGNARHSEKPRQYRTADVNLPFLSTAYRRLFFTSPPPFASPFHFSTSGSTTLEKYQSFSPNSSSMHTTSSHTPDDLPKSFIQCTDFHLLILQIPQEKLYCNASNLHHVSFVNEKNEPPQ